MVSTNKTILGYKIVLPPCTLESLTYEHIYQTLERCNWVRAKAAYSLAVCPRTVRYYIHKLKERGYHVPDSEFRKDISYTMRKYRSSKRRKNTSLRRKTK